MTPCDNCQLKLKIEYDPDMARVECPYFDGCGVIKKHNEKIMEQLKEKNKNNNKKRKG